MVGPDRTAAAVGFPALDSLRAVAAIAVLATHSAFWSGGYALPVWGTALARLDVGVAVFFVLSGFLLSRPWIARHRAGMSPPSTVHYLWKRALRLVPVYVVTVVAAMTLLPDNRDAGIGEWVTTLLLGNIYVDDGLPDGLTQMWSLSTEVAFYLVLPGLMWLALARVQHRGRDRVALVAAGMTLVSVAWLVDLSVRWDGGGTMIRLWLPSYLVWFAAGIVLAWCDVRLRDDQDHDGQLRPVRGPMGRLPGVLREMGHSPGLCWLAAGALLVIASTPLAGPADLTPTTTGAALTKNLLYAAIAALVILPGVFAPADGRFLRVLSLPLLRHVGHLSYGIFCVHLVVLELVASWRDMPLFEGRGLELFALTLLASLLVSEVLHRLVERPTLRLRNVWTKESTSAAASAPSATATIS